MCTLAKSLFIISCLCVISFYSYSQKTSNKPTIFPLGSLSTDTAVTWLSAAFDSKIDDNVTIVGLGEFTHGAHETFIYKYKMIQYLVEKKNYRNILMEYPNVTLSSLNNYLTNKNSLSTDSAKTLAEKTYEWSIKDKSLYSLIVWIKEYNLAHPTDMVNIKGIDITGASTAFANYFMDKCLIPLDTRVAAAIRSKFNQNQKDSITVAEISWFNNHSEKVKQYLNKTDYDEVLYNLKNAKYQLAHSIVEKNHIYKASAIRDSIMAVNVAELSNTSKSIIWAHNMHICTTRGAYSLGNYLRSMVGNKYFNILTDFSDTATVWFINNARILTQNTFTSKKHSAAAVIKAKFKTGAGIVFFDDVKRLKIKPVYNNIDASGNHFSLGGGKPFDALVFFKIVEPCR